MVWRFVGEGPRSPSSEDERIEGTVCDGPEEGESEGGSDIACTVEFIP